MQASHSGPGAQEGTVSPHGEDAIEIEPIHRVLFDTDARAVRAALDAYCAAHGLALAEGAGEQTFTFVTAAGGETLHFAAPNHPLTVGTIDGFVFDYLAKNPAARVDYIHGEDSVAQLCRHKGGVGLLMPPFDKGDIFKGVVLGGVLPRKTFSMGHAEEKRYYLEARAITE